MKHEISSRCGPWVDARGVSKPKRALRVVLAVEELESRVVPSAGTLRVVTYNMEADINGDTTPLPGFYQVVEGIGEEKLQNDVQPVDILALEETTSNTTTIAPIVTNLNSYYNGLAVYAQSSYQATQSGGNTDGNGPNGLVYNTKTLTLLASVGVGTPGGSSNGEYRQVVRYEFQPVGDSGSVGIFYVYVSHMKSGSTSADATARGEEATIIRNDEATLSANASVLYTGDLNSAPPEAEFTEFTSAGQGEAYDPLNFSTSVQYYSESATDLRYRDDYQLMTANVLNDTGGLGYVSGTLHSFGNNGTTPSGGSVNSGSDTALNSDLFQDGGTFISASTLYSDLTTGSDHLPVVADYSVPISPAIVMQPSGQSVTAGATATFTATASGSPTPTVQWQVSTNGGASYSPISGATSTTLTLTSVVLTQNNNKYEAVFSNSTGSATTNAALLQVSPVTTTTTLTDNGPNPSIAGQNVTFTVNVSPAVPNGETVTLEDASSGNAPVGSGTLTSGSVMINVSNLTVGSHNLFAVYGGDATTYAGSQSSQATQVVHSATTTVNLSLVDINSDAANTAIFDGGVQRSMVDSVVYHFNTAVNLDTSAITITLHSGVTVTLGNGTQSSGTVGTVPDATTWASPDGGFTWVVTFGGAGVTGGGSIADGVYDITLNAAHITTASGGAVMLNNFQGGTGSETDTFWSLFGDANQDQKVTAQDYGAFASTYLARSSDPAYIPWFDQQGDDKVTAQDYGAFAGNYLKKYAGFMATI